MFVKSYRKIILFAWLILSTSIVMGQGGFPVHPAYDIINLRPSMLNINVGGMDWLSDGRLVIAHWGTESKQGAGHQGSIFILDNVETEDPSKITYQQLGSGLDHPLGLTVIQDKIYVMDKSEITVYSEINGNFTKLNSETISGWDYNPNLWGQWSHGLVYKEGFFYTLLGSAFPDHDGANNESLLKNQPQGRCKIIKVSLATGQFEEIANGLRSPNGLNIGPDGELFYTDNQGRWFQTNRLNHIEEGSFYGYRSAPTDLFINNHKQPAVHMAYGALSFSSTGLVLLESGPYQGQILVGDVTFGGLTRYFLEKVNGEYQGAGFRFSGGFSAGTHRLQIGPDGDVYVGELGDINCPRDNNFCWNNQMYGLEKMKLKNNLPDFFDIVAVRSRVDGMELEFNKELDNSVLDINQYSVDQAQVNNGAMEYGCCKENEEILTIQSAQLSWNKKRIFLEIPGLKELRMVHIQANVTDDSGDTPWSKDTWYTLNAISNSQPFEDIPVPVGANRTSELNPIVYDGRDLYIKSGMEEFTLLISDLTGKTLKTYKDHRKITISEGLNSGMYMVILNSEKINFTQKIIIP